MGSQVSISVISLASFPGSWAGEEERESGTHCSHMHQGPMVTCILLQCMVAISEAHREGSCPRMPDIMNPLPIIMHSLPIILGYHAPPAYYPRISCNPFFFEFSFKTLSPILSVVFVLCFLSYCLSWAQAMMCAALARYSS